MKFSKDVWKDLNLQQKYPVQQYQQRTGWLGRNFAEKDLIVLMDTPIRHK